METDVKVKIRMVKQEAKPLSKKDLEYIVNEVEGDFDKNVKLAEEMLKNHWVARECPIE